MNSNVNLNIARAGEFFMYCLWLQGQMCDLLIFKKFPELISPFVANSDQMPKEFTTHRAKYWEKELGGILKEFITQFGDVIKEDELADLQAISYLRNAIAHSHVSLGRDYLLYRPGRGLQAEESMINALDLQPVAGESNPRMMTLRLYEDDRYLKDFNRIKRIDEICFNRIATSLGVPHGRIR